MELVHIKMRNGEDLLGYLTSQTEKDIEIMTPISIMIDPQFGMFAKSWLIFSELNSARISTTDYMFFSAASRKATEYYEEFMHRLSEREQVKTIEEDTEFNSELEEVFSALMQSRESTKH